MNINAGFYTVFENIKFNNIGYLNINFYYNVEVYNIIVLINGRFGSGSINTVNSGGCGGSSKITSVKIVFNKLIIIFESFSEIIGGFKLFNKNIIFKLKALNTKNITDTKGNFRT